MTWIIFSVSGALVLIALAHLCRKCKWNIIAQLLAACGTMALAGLTYVSTQTSLNIAEISLQEPKWDGIAKFTDPSELWKGEEFEWWRDKAVSENLIIGNLPILLQATNIGKTAARPESVYPACEIIIDLFDSLELATMRIKGKIYDLDWTIEKFRKSYRERAIVKYNGYLYNNDTLFIILILAKSWDKKEIVDEKIIKKSVVLSIWSPQNIRNPSVLIKINTAGGRK